MFTTICPGCEASLNAPDSLKGKKVKCKKCGEPFVARPNDTDDDEPPRKTVKMRAAPSSRSKRSDDDDPTEEGPAVKGKKSRRPADDDDTEVMESVRDDDDEEDEPRPTKKKGAGKGKKKKKKEGSPAMLIVLIAVGGIVLLGGGGVGAYFAFFANEEPKTETQAKGGTTPGTTGGRPAAVATAGWVEFHDQTGKYRVKFPQQPSPPINQRQSLPNGETIDIKLVALTLGNEAFISGHAFLPAALADTPAEQVLEMAATDQNARAKGAVIKSNKSITYQGFPGREVAIDFPGKKTPTIMRVFHAKDRMIMLVVASEIASADSPRVKAFFESLQIE